MSEKTNRKSLRWIVAAILAVVLCVCLCFGVACKKTNKEAQGDAGYFTKTDPGNTKPEEGYNGNEYVNYVAYVLEQQTEWYAVSDSQAKASVNNQQIWTDKYYKDGYMLTTQKSKSSFSNEAFEALFVTGRQGSAEEERGVYLRDGSKPKNKDHDFSDITWDDGTPTYYLEEDYYFLHGLFSDEMSVFVINDQTIEKADAVVKNSDGTYSQHFVLDTDDSVYYYQYSMKNHGGLSTFPAFEKVEVTMTFNEAFELLKLETTEQSKVKKAGSNWTNKTTATTTYTYPDMTAENDPNGKGLETIWSENQSTLDEAQTYFDEYYGKLEPTTDREIVYTPDASDVLIGAIGDALTSEGETYGMYISYNDKADAIDASGYIYLAIDLESWEDLTFDFSGFSTMDWVTFALEAYQYTHIIVEVDGNEGEQALIVDLLSGSNILEILSGKLIEVYIGEGALGSAAEDEIVGNVENGLNEILAAMYVVMAQALDEEEEVGDDEGMTLTLEYNDDIGTNSAKVALIMDGFELYVDCDITKRVGEEGNTYEYALVEMTLSMPSIGLDIVLTPVSGDKMSYVTPNETTTGTESSVGSLGLETLVMDLVYSVINLSSSSYINESYTFTGDLELAIDVDLADYGLDMSSILGTNEIDITIEIDNLVITIGDILDDFYISFVGDLQDSVFEGSMSLFGQTIPLSFDVAVGSTIGLTWYNDKIVLVRDLQTETPEHGVYTTSSFVAEILGDDSPLAWLLGTDSTIWGILAGFFDSDSDDAETTSLVQPLSENTQYLFDWLNIGYYVSAMEVKLGEELGASIGDIDVEDMFGLTDDYWAFVLGDNFISGITSGIVDSAAIAITQSMSQLGGIYVVGSVYGLLDLTLNLNYESNLNGTYDLFGGNLVLAETQEVTVTDEEGNETIETVTVEKHIVPNLYKVFEEGMEELGISESSWTFEDTTLELDLSVSSGYGSNKKESSYNGEAAGSFVCYEYTVGDTKYTTVYAYSVSWTDESTAETWSSSGFVSVETTLPGYEGDDDD